MSRRAAVPRAAAAVLLAPALAAGMAAAVTTAARPLAAQPPRAATPPQGARLVLPPEVVADEPVTASAVTLDGRPLSGVAVSVSGEEYVTDGDGRVTFVPPPGLFRLTVTLPDAAGEPPRAQAPVIRRPADLPRGAPPALESSPPYAVPGAELLLEGGPFDGVPGGGPDDGSEALRVTLDGTPLPILAASPTGLVAATDYSSALGEHELVVETDGGSTEPAALTFVRLLLQASAESLEPGQKDVAILTVEGTRERVCLRITNLAKEVAALKDGDTFFAQSSGGKKNTAEIKYTSVRPGHFALGTEVVGEGGKECRNR
jgi:hypothetical protein